MQAVDVKPSDWANFLREYEPGATVRSRGFTMVSTDAPYRGNVRIHVDSTGGKDISPVVAVQGRVVFPDNEAFKVISREFDPRTSIWNIYVEDLGR